MEEPLDSCSVLVTCQTITDPWPLDCSSSSSQLTMAPPCLRIQWEIGPATWDRLWSPSTWGVSALTTDEQPCKETSCRKP